MKILFIFLTLITAPLYGKKYDVALCAIFQNEARWMEEWIEFHQLVGVEHFYLYNNNSTDDFESVLEPYVRSGVVELIDWPQRPHAKLSYNEIQCKAYEDALKRAKGITRWLVVVDLDEFLFPTKANTLQEVLRHFRKFGGVGVNWQMFGTSSVAEVPKDRLMIETLIKKAPPDYQGNRHIKSIVQPRCVAGCQNPHSFLYKPPFYQVNTRKKSFSGPGAPSVELDVLRINHYWTRDEKFLHEIKIPRRLEWGQGPASIIQVLPELSQVEETAILRFVPELRKCIEKKVVKVS